MVKLPYTSCFAELVVKPLVSKAKDELLAKASLVEVSHFLPKIDTSVNLDVLPVAFAACIVNRVNKNKDVIDTDTALAVYKQFINKPINVEHNRQRVIGTILTAGFSEFSTDKPITEEEAKKLTGPFNIMLGGVIWRIVCPELADHIEEASDPSSQHYLSVSASWELGFTGYKVALLPAGAKNLSEAKILSKSEEIDPIKDKLVSLGGDGKVDDLFAFRMPSQDVLPLGIGFTEKPAAEVKGIATINNQPEVGIPQTPAFAGKDEELEQDIISQSSKNNVKEERIRDMKITSIQDITDETLQQCSASSIAEFISSELKKGSDAWLEEKNKLNTQLAKATEDAAKLQAEYEAMKKQVTEVQATVESLNKEKAEREAVEKFNGRMAALAADYDFDDEVRAAIVEEIKALSSDEDFDKWQAKAKVLLKGFAKKKEAKEEKKEEKKEEMGKKEDCNASEQETLASATQNGEQEKGGLPNGSSAAEPTLKEKYATAFAMEGFEITK